MFGKCCGKKTKLTADKGAQKKWFAFIETDDPMLDGYEFPENSRCRILLAKNIPAFELKVDGEQVKYADPRDILFALGHDRIKFLWESDKKPFIYDLSDTLSRRDRWEKRLKNGVRTAIVAGVVLLAGTVLVWNGTKAFRKNRK